MQSVKYQLAVIVINYKTPDLTIECLQSLVPELSDINAKVLVIDNNSADDSCEIIQNWITINDTGNWITIIASEHNAGFSAGNNLGIKSINADYYLLINSDTLVRKGGILRLLEYAEIDSSAGLIGPRLEWMGAMSQESCFKFHTPKSELISSASTGLLTALLKEFVVPQAVSEEIACYDWISFACVLIKSKVFKDIGLLDDGYFMYYEDVEFCYRAKQKGWKIVNVPTAHVVHLRGGSSTVKSQIKLRKRLPSYFYKSRTRYFYQVYGLMGLLMANVYWTLGYGISLLRSLLSSSFKPNISAYQWRDIWTNFFTPLKPYIYPDKYDKT